MTEEQIFELAEEHGDWDDFGRWTFRDDDKLLSFVAAIQKEKRETTKGCQCQLCARALEDKLKEKNT